MTRVKLELALGRVVASAENYLLRQAATALKPELLGPTRPPDPADKPTKDLRLAAKFFKQLIGLWKREFAIDLTNSPKWADFDTLRELRHVLVHRLGRWEPGLDPKPKLDQRVRLLGIEPAIYRGQIPLFKSDLDTAIRMTIALVDEADGEFARQGLAKPNQV
jgi:hypothetical protein